MGADETRKIDPSSNLGWMYETYYFLAVAFHCAGFLFLLPLLIYVQNRFISQYRQDLVFVFYLGAPFFLFLLIRWTTGRILAGRVFLYSLGSALSLFFLYPVLTSRIPFLPEYRPNRAHPVVLTLAWPIVCFGLNSLLDRWTQWAKHRRARKRLERGHTASMEMPGIVPTPEQTANLRLPERLRPVKYPADREPRSALGRALLNLYSLGIVFLTCWAVIWACNRIEPMRLPHAPFFPYLVLLVSPALILGALHITRARLNALMICLACLLSMLVLHRVTSFTFSVFHLAFPAVAFLAGYGMTLRKPKARHRLETKPGEDKKPLDFDLQHRRRMGAQIERKYRSKRDNSHWYHHPYY